MPLHLSPLFSPRISSPLFSPVSSALFCLSLSSPFLSSLSLFSLSFLSFFLFPLLSSLSLSPLSLFFLFSPLVSFSSLFFSVFSPLIHQFKCSPCLFGHGTQEGYCFSDGPQHQTILFPFTGAYWCSATMMAKSFLCALLGIWQLIVARADNGKRVTVTEVVFDSAVSDMRWLGSRCVGGRVALCTHVPGNM